MSDYYELEVAGLRRQLPICKVNDDISIAAFIMFSDVELTIKVAAALLERCPEFDIIMTAEAKGIPLAYEMARQSQKPYIVARKMNKLYMSHPIKMEVKSISTERTQVLFLDQDEMDMLKDKRVLIVDDVISTGGSLYAMEEMAKMAGGNIVAKATVLAEGEAAERTDIIYLEKLPLFNTATNQPI